MASDQEVELYRSHSQSQQKYTYFLLAAAAAAIGLAVRATSSATLHWSLIPLAVAVLLWGVSFVLGCKYILYTQSNAYANFELLRFQRGEHPLAGKNPDLIRAASEGITEAIESNAKQLKRFGDGQFLFLVIGAVLFVAWHVLGIVLRSGHAEPLC